MASKTYILHLDTKFDSAVGRIIEGVTFVEKIDAIEAIVWVARAALKLRMQSHCILTLNGTEAEIERAISTVFALGFVKDGYEADQLPEGLADDVWASRVDAILAHAAATKGPILTVKSRDNQTIDEIEFDMDGPSLVCQCKAKVYLSKAPPNARIFVNGSPVEHGHEVGPNDKIAVVLDQLALDGPDRSAELEAKSVNTSMATSKRLYDEVADDEVVAVSIPDPLAKIRRVFEQPAKLRGERT